VRSSSMNDLDLVRDLRADVPSPTRERLAPGRARLLASVSRPSRPRYARRAVLPVTAAASAVAVAAASGAFSGPATRSAAVKPPAIRLTLTAQLLSTAAATVAKHPAVRPGPHQWFYTKFVGHDYGQPTQSNENWETFDGRRTAYFQNGQLIVHKTLGAFGGGGPAPLGEYNASATPRTAYNALASLPSNPRALLAVIAKQIAKVGGPSVAAGSAVSLYAPK